MLLQNRFQSTKPQFSARNHTNQVFQHYNAKVEPYEPQGFVDRDRARLDFPVGDLEVKNLDPPVASNGRSPHSQQKTGFNNIQFKRLATEKDSLGSSLYRPWVVLEDYFRALLVLNKQQLRDLIWYLFPSDPIGGFSKSVAHLPDVPFKLVPGIKEYRGQYKDMDTKGIIGYEPILERTIPANPIFLLHLCQICPIAAYEEIDPNNIKDMKFNVCINLGGQYFEDKDTIEVYQIFSYLYNVLDAKCTRLDYRVDIPHEFGLLPMVMESYFQDDKDNPRVWPQEYFNHYGTNKKGDHHDTFYIGSPNSNYRLAIYRTQEKHTYDAARVEPRFYAAKAHELFVAKATYCDREDSKSILTRKPEKVIRRELQELMANYLAGQTQFITAKHTRANKSIKQLDVHPLWEEFKQKVLAYNPIRVKIPKPAKRADVNTEALERQYGPTLAKLYLGLGVDKFLEAMKFIAISSTKRLTPIGMAVVEVIKACADRIMAEIKGTKLPAPSG